MAPQRNRILVFSALSLAILLAFGSDQLQARQAQPAANRSDTYSYARLKGRQTIIFNGWVDAVDKESGSKQNPATAYGKLLQTQRSTFEAITHALSRSKLTAEGGAVLKPSALDLIESLQEIAGAIKGVGGDKQFRLYVTLVPNAQDLLAKSHEFFRDKDNTVFHKEYPINYRQRGRVPTLQISISKDGRHADIDVDYRSSKAPQALINGHLRAANSDVRIGKNYLGHVGRWFGLIRWWRILTAETEEAAADETPASGASSSKTAAVTPPARTGPPPTLTAAQMASGQEVAGVMNEFLNTWLVKRNKARADDYLVKRPIACANLDDDSENETVSGEVAIKEFALLLDAALRAKTKVKSIADAVEALEPWDPDQIFVDHPFKKLFSVRAVDREEAASYICDSSKFAGDPKGYGDYFITTFTLNLAKESGGGLELLWMKEDGQWQIISYDILEQ